MELQKRIESFLEEKLGSFYCEVLSSRWSNVMQKLCQTTQQLKCASLLAYPTVEMNWNAALALANTLLDEEHRIIQEGGILCRALESSGLLMNVSSSSSAFLRREKQREKEEKKRGAVSRADREINGSSQTVAGSISLDTFSSLAYSSTSSSLAETTGGVSRGAREFEFFLSSLLTQVALKESILAEWAIKKDEVLDDALRVYAHACIASFAFVTRQKIDRLRLLLCSSG